MSSKCRHRDLELVAARVLGGLNQYRCRGCGTLFLATTPHVDPDASMISLWSVTLDGG
jgi:hypothetical protein